ncbi:MAG: ComEA family DNA-binding protein [Chloroflexales bacterium]|nr:ComEA family DNA-binding protein [Chloroflexales bacterium]
MQELEFSWHRFIRPAALGCVVVGLALLAFRFVIPSDTGSSYVATSGLIQADKGSGILLAVPAVTPVIARKTDSTALDPVKYVAVYITGAVARPEVYKLPHDARIKDVVLAAGGLTDDADSERINLAAHIEDAQHIHILRIGETAAPVAGSGAGMDSSASSASNLVNLNTASAAELEDLDGIGQKLAERIITYRETEGPFESVDDLGNVTGIGSKLLNDLRPLVTVGP